MWNSHLVSLSSSSSSSPHMALTLHLFLLYRSLVPPKVLAIVLAFFSSKNQSLYLFLKVDGNITAYINKMITWLHTVNIFLDLMQVLPRNLLMDNNVRCSTKTTWPEHIGLCDGSTYSRLKRRVLSWTAVSTEVSLLSCKVFVKLWSPLSKSFCKISIGYGRHDECTINVLRTITTVNFKSIFTTKSR